MALDTLPDTLKNDGDLKKAVKFMRTKMVQHTKDETSERFASIHLPNTIPGMDIVMYLMSLGNFSKEEAQDELEEVFMEVMSRTTTTQIKLDMELLAVNERKLKLTKSNSSPSSGAGVISHYALHIWNSQEESHPNKGRNQIYTSTIGDFSSISLLLFPREPSTLTLPYSTSPQQPIKTLLQLQTGACLIHFRPLRTTNLRRYVYPQGGNSVTTYKARVMVNGGLLL